MTLNYSWWEAAPGAAVPAVGNAGGLNLNSLFQNLGINIGLGF